ncbi:MAG TPA: LPS assembly protein LptD [Micropepsaceae bacterium]|nr:LPS assembly protein LptD [Micropepsaceae bacterium]
MKRKRGKRGHIWREARTAAVVVSAAAMGIAIGLHTAQAQTREPSRVLLQADEITYDTSTGVVTAKGHVEISDDERTLLANEVVYNENTDTVTATGNVSLQDATGNVAYADSVELTQDLREGALKGFAALIGQNGRLAASAGERREGRFTIAHGAVFTPCAICQEEGERMPLWEIRAARIVHDQLEKQIYFEDASFDFLGVPVFYLPYFSQADPTVKYKSGFLLPDVGTIGSLGSFIKVPYYIALSPNRDLTIDPFITSNAGAVLQTEYRQRWGDGGLWLQGTLGYDSSASGKPGESIWMSSLFGSGRLPLTDSWRTGFDVQLSSNKTYLKRYEFSNQDRLTTDLFADRVSGRSRAEITGYYFQSLRATDLPGQIPIALPLMQYTYIPEYKVWGGRFKANASALYLNRDQGTDVLRGSADVDWRLPYTTNDGQLFTLEGFLRGDTYYIEDARFEVPSAAKNTEMIGRALGYGMLEWRWPFAGDVGIPNTSVVIEPIAQLVVASGGGNPRGLPNEDSTAFEFDVTNLFSANPSPGLDLWTGGPRSNVGVRASALLPYGTVSATLGQQFRFTSGSSFPAGFRLNDDKSDIVGQFKIDFPPNLSLTHQFNIDPSDGTIRRNEVYLRARLGRSVIDLSYLKLPTSAADPTLGEQEQVNLTTTILLYRYWGVFGEARRDLATGKMLESSIGITYDDECFVASLGFHRRDTATLNLKPASSVIFRIGLKTGFTGS